MEFILQNTNIFDENIDSKLNDVIMINKKNFISDQIYKLTVNFPVNLLKDRRFQEFTLPPSKIFNNTNEDRIHNVLSLQLERLGKILNNHGIETGSSTIQGDCLESENIIKIEISEDTSEPSYLGKSKIKTSWILPSKPYQDEIISKVVSDHMTPIFNDLTVKNLKIMSEVLEIEETEDENVIFRVFAKKYINLWLGSAEEKHELINKYQERVLAAINKHSPKEPNS